MINEDTLTLYYYDDGLSAAERRQVEDALKRDTALATRYKSLCAELQGWQLADEGKMPDHLLHNFHDTIDRAARLERNRGDERKPPLHFLSFFWGAAVTAAFALGIGATVYFSGDSNTELMNTVVNYGETTVPASFTRGLSLHLQDSRFELAKLSDDSPAERMQLIAQIIDQNRMFERAAVNNNSQNIARVLRAFEPILLRLASDDIAPEDAESLRAQLSFELTIVLTKLAQRPSEEPQTI